MNRILEALKVLGTKIDKSEKKEPVKGKVSEETPRYFEQGLPLLEQSGPKGINKDWIITGAVVYVAAVDPKTGQQMVRRLHSVGITKAEFEWIEKMGHNRIPLDDKHDPDNEW